MTNYLSNLPKTTIPKKKRLGRGTGSGAGAKSGRGTTRHQAARQDIPLAFEGGQGRMVKRFPLLRGKGRNRSYTIRPAIVTLDDLNTFNDGEQVTVQTLIDKGLVDKSYIKAGVKVLANGTLNKKVTVALPVSAQAKEHIEKAGGSVKTS